MTVIHAARPSTLSQAWYGEDGTALDPGVVTVAVTRDVGTTQTVAAAVAGTGTSPRTVTLTAAEVGADPDRLTVVWTSATQGVRTQVVDVVGGWIVELGAIRADMPASNFSADQLRRARDWFEGVAEAHCGVAFRPRYRRYELVGDGSTWMVLPDLYVREVVWASIDAEDQVLDDWVLEGSKLRTVNTLAWGKASVVGYRYGMDAPPPELVDVGLLAVKDVLGRADRRASRTLSATDQFGTTQRDSVESTRYPTGIPAVDAVLNRLKEQ